MKKIQFLVIIIQFCIFFLINSCIHREKSVILNKSDKQEVIKIIPKNKYGGSYFPYELVKKTTKRAGLNFLDNGYDSVFIRLWYVYRFSLQVVDLKKNQGVWKAESHNMQLDLINDTIQPVNIKSNPAFPKSGWESFTSKLFSLNILNLPDDSEIKDYHLNNATDASFITVEIATINKYKIYSYTEPYVHLEFLEARSMENIIKLIDEELGLKRAEKL